MKLSCTDNMVPGNTLTEKGHLLRKLGYQGMAVFCDYRDWNGAFEEELMALQERTGIKPCEFVFTGPLYGHLMDDDPDVRREALSLYKRSIGVANRLGAITEMEFEYRSQDPLPLFDPYQRMPEAQQEIFIGVVNALGAEVGDTAWMLIEGCNRYETRYLTRLCDCREMLEKADPACTRRMGLLADFFHMAIEEDDIERSIVESGAWIRHVHLGDSNRLAPGHGHTDWRAGMRALKAIGFDGYMNLECKLPGPPESVLPEVADFLKRAGASA